MILISYLTFKYPSIFEDTMAEMQSIKSTLCSLVLAMIFLSGCSDPYIAQIAQQTPLTEQRVALLDKALTNGDVRNANLIKQYSQKLMAQKPELSPLINEFKKDASTQGPLFKSLTDRLKTVKNNPQMFASNEAVYQELQNIYQAADPILYSDALSDPLNVLADMSEGVLPRVNALSKSQSQKMNNAQDFGTGEQLIGNPGYGQWSTGSNGMSFWAWYGMYSMMGNIMGPRVSYNSWGRNRNYSYYHDYGRTRYSSPSQLSKQNKLETRTRKSFANKGQGFTSAYSKNRTGASSVSRQSKTAQTSATRFKNKSMKQSSFASKSAFGKKSSFGQNSSFRNSSSTTSRGFMRGK